MKWRLVSSISCDKKVPLSLQSSSTNWWLDQLCCKKQNIGQSRILTFRNLKAVDMRITQCICGYIRKDMIKMSIFETKWEWLRWKTKCEKRDMVQACDVMNELLGPQTHFEKLKGAFSNILKYFLHTSNRFHYFFLLVLHFYPQQFHSESAKKNGPENR